MPNGRRRFVEKSTLVIRSTNNEGMQMNGEKMKRGLERWKAVEEY
jgi:hypothetical protein